jgi:hypothetical protein
MHFGSLYYFLEYLNKNRFLEIEKGVNSKGRFRPKASALWPAMVNGPKGLMGLAAVARSSCHTT